MDANSSGVALRASSPRVAIPRSILDEPRSHLKAEPAGAGYRSGAWVPDREMRWNISPRNLNVGK